ncbi:uncharacterized protein Dwil_GK24766 [Drosophila willistoni]|uniref:Uncharacterized protein n=1 Tax=Drosophila willistoni TaxID=7260 RepID=A0A0Q9X1Z2_DROWI|nr:uncharacterized protein Dwil_GK24766 [Drosophila willistoni]
MKFKYQKKHKQLKSIKRALRHVATGLLKAFFYLGTPTLCPYHQACLLSGVYPGFYYLGLVHCTGCNLCSICLNPSTLCSGNFTNSFAQCESLVN